MSTAQQLPGETSSGACFWSADPPQLSIDPNGNLTQKLEGNDTWTYEWDAENRLKRVLKNAAEVARYAYDPLGRRVEKVAGATITWAYDGEDILREVSGAATLKYVHGLGIDEPLAQEDGAGTLSFFHADGLGSIVKTTSSAGAVTGSKRYDTFGNLELGATNGYAYTGREWDAETGLAYYRARYYDPKIGRFLSEDPIPLAARAVRELNAYAYVGNNPVNYTDPLGLAMFETCPGRIKREVDAQYCSKNAPNQAANDPSCREAHCIANCRISRECAGGQFTAAAASKWKEFTDTWDPTSGTGWDPGDQAANNKGRVCGSSPYTQGWTCEELCKGTR